MDFTYKHCRVKQYLKGGRALRVETVVNVTRDFEIGRRLAHLPEVFATVRQVNHRLLMIERAGQACRLETVIFERISQPYAREGSRTGALRFGDPGVTSLAGALCAHVHAVSGFTNKEPQEPRRRPARHGLHPQPDELRPSTTTTPWPHRPTAPNQHLHPHPRRRPLLFYAKITHRLLRPLLAADHPPAPKELRQALRVIDRHLHDYVTTARLAPPA